MTARLSTFVAKAKELKLTKKQREELSKSPDTQSRRRLLSRYKKQAPKKIRALFTVQNISILVALASVLFGTYTLTELQKKKQKSRKSTTSRRTSTSTTPTTTIKQKKSQNSLWKTMKNRTNNLGKSTKKKKMVRVSQAKYNSDFMGNEGININGWRNMLNTGSLKKIIHKDAVIEFGNGNGNTQINLLTILDRLTLFDRLTIYLFSKDKKRVPKKNFSTFVEQLNKKLSHPTQKDRIKYAQKVLIRIVSQISGAFKKKIEKHNELKVVHFFPIKDDFEVEHAVDKNISIRLFTGKHLGNNVRSDDTTDPNNRIKKVKINYNSSNIVSDPKAIATTIATT